MLITSQSEQLWISEVSIHGLLSVPSTHCDLKYVNKLLDISLFKNGDEFPSCRLNLVILFFLRSFKKIYIYLFSCAGSWLQHPESVNLCCDMRDL